MHETFPGAVFCHRFVHTPFVHLNFFKLEIAQSKTLLQTVRPKVLRRRKRQPCNPRTPTRRRLTAMLDSNTSAMNMEASTVVAPASDKHHAQLTRFGPGAALQACEEPVGRITLALDLDETLIKSFEMHDSDTPESDILANSLLERFTVTFSNGDRYVVFKRPGLDEFLHRVARVFDVVIFSAAAEDYLLKICSVLDPQGAVFKNVYSRSSCSFAAPVGLSIYIFFVLFSIVF